MRFYTPHEGPPPRALAEEGIEVWAPAIVGKSLFVSNLGRLRRDTELRNDDSIIEPRTNKTTGQVSMYVRGVGRRYVHYLVLTAFEGHTLLTVRRFNQDRQDNRLCNLGWVRDGGRLPRKVRAMVEAVLDEGMRPCDVARQFDITSSHVCYYKNKTREKPR